MPLEHLQAVAALDVPYAAGAIARRRDDLVALRVEGDLGDLALVAWSGLGLGLGLGLRFGLGFGFGFGLGWG